MQTQVKDMVRKLNHMSPDRLAEINDFIDFIRTRDQGLNLNIEFSQASESAFAKVWNNDDDAAYDAL
jgi:hypothetical protein